MENRHTLLVDTRVAQAKGFAEREAALSTAADLGGSRRVTLGDDKGFYTRDFVWDLRAMNATPHVAGNTTRRSMAIDGRTIRHSGYSESQKRHKRVGEIFGWLKTAGLMRKTRHRSLGHVGWMFSFAVAVYNVVRTRTLLPDTG